MQTCCLFYKIIKTCALRAGARKRLAIPQLVDRHERVATYGSEQCPRLVLARSCPDWYGSRLSVGSSMQVPNESKHVRVTETREQTGETFGPSEKLVQGAARRKQSQPGKTRARTEGEQTKWRATAAALICMRPRSIHNTNAHVLRVFVQDCRHLRWLCAESVFSSTSISTTHLVTVVTYRRGTRDMRK